MLDVYFVLTPRFLMLDFAGPAEAFAYAAKAGAALRMHFLAAGASLESAVGLEVRPFEPLPRSLPDRALVFVCGSMNALQSLRTAKANATVEWLRRTVTTKQALACVCSGALLAGRAGLLDGRACTTHHSLTDELRRSAPGARVLEDRIFVVDGPVATSAGVTAGLDLALHLLEQQYSASLAQQIARELVVWMRRTGSDPQLSPWLAYRNHLHPVVHAAQDAVSRAPGEDWSLPRLARHSHTSIRNLTRLFRQHTGLSVVEYVQRVRAAQARQLLENPRVTVESVAESVGLQSARSLRRVLARAGAPTPSGIRQQQMLEQAANRAQ